MPKYKVPCKYTNTEIIVVEAGSKEEAMEIAQDRFDNYTSIEVFEGDVEVHYHDIIEITK